MAKMRGADIIAEYLVKEEVPYLFGLCGHGIIGFLDALYDRQDKIKAMTVRHEQAAGHMADAYFRVAHRPVATFTSCGPGSTNLPTALASAMMDSSALLAITGNVPTSQFNRSPFQETGRHFQAEYPNVIRPYVKKSFQPTRVDMIPLAMRQAFKTMLTGRTGPVHIDVPLNCFAEEADVEVPEPESGTGRKNHRTVVEHRKALYHRRTWRDIVGSFPANSEIGRFAEDSRCNNRQWQRNHSGGSSAESRRDRPKRNLHGQRSLPILRCPAGAGGEV
jgi:thiamine pyrophosphate-dependent acetolactate synthase large subunit-like protein